MVPAGVVGDTKLHNSAIAGATFAVAAILLGLKGTAEAASSQAVILPGPGPVTMQNRDEPGRNLYQENGHGTCGTTNCWILFSVVPRGRNRVVQHVSCAMSYPATTSVYLVTVGTQPSRAPQDYLPLGTRTYADSYYYSVINQSTEVFFAGGETPRIDTYFVGGAFAKLSCTLAGYDVLLP